MPKCVVHFCGIARTWTFYAVWPDLAIYWTLGNFLKPLATINLPQSPPFLGNFCKGVKSVHFSSETIFGQLLWTLAIFFLVTLLLYIQDLFSLLPLPKVLYFCLSFYSSPSSISSLHCSSLCPNDSHSTRNETEWSRKRWKNHFNPTTIFQ